jgi:hypothetical protein
MRKLCVISLILAFSMTFVLPCTAQDNDFAARIIKSGLLGAGAGAIGGAASGAKGRDIWKGALAGAGMNIIGGALLESLTQGSGNRTQNYYTAQPQYYTAQPRAYNSNTGTSAYPGRYTYEEVYREGYLAGYKAGYMKGLEDGSR